MTCEKALREIAEGAIVSPDQPPGKIAEQALRVLQLAREENLEYLKIISVQQRRAERAEAALEAIQHRAEYMLEGADSFVDSANWEKVRGIAHAAIAAAKGEVSEETELV